MICDKDKQILNQIFYTKNKLTHYIIGPYFTNVELLSKINIRFKIVCDTSSFNLINFYSKIKLEVIKALDKRFKYITFSKVLNDTIVTTNTISN